MANVEQAKRRKTEADIEVVGKDHIVGMKNLCDYLEVSDSTVRKWEKNQGFPIRRLDGFIIASKRSIARWFASRTE